MEKQRKYEERQERRAKTYADQTLDDLRERLLDKRRNKESSDEYKYEKESRRKVKEIELEDSEMFVKEIIDLSTNDEIRDQKRDKHHHRREREIEKEDFKEEEEKEKRVLTDAEREEQELRKEKLLEAGK